jgi:uncharacterized lipoprotein
MKLIKNFLLLCALLGLTACSANKSNDYRANEMQPSAAEIQVPRSYLGTEMEQDYPIPDLITNERVLQLPGFEPPRDPQ